ncbi:MAG: hypothetical protein ACYDAD_08690 [Acidimicrobiales bacterium]
MSTTSGSPPAPVEDHGRSRLFWPSVVVGWSVMTWALLGLLRQHRDTNPVALGRLFLGLNLVHDLLLAPLVLVAGVFVRRLTPRRARGPVQAALLCTGVLLLVSEPFVRGYGRRRANPSILPNNYGHGLVVVLVGVWTVAMLIIAGDALSRRRGRRRPSRSGAAATHQPVS